VRYEQQYEGEWVQPVCKGYRMACCDCGLVHSMDFRVKEKKIQFRAFRHARSTAAMRRHMLAWRELSDFLERQE
jgi:hypothetical protein